MTEAKIRQWAVWSPWRIRWRPKFSSEDAAWRRVTNYLRFEGESEMTCRARLRKQGWRVTYEPDIDPSLDASQPQFQEFDL